MCIERSAKHSSNRVINRIVLVLILVFMMSWGAAWALTETETQTETAKLVAPDGLPYDNFGMAVAVDGDTAAISQYTVVANGGDGIGSVYMFTRSGSTWTLQDILKGPASAGGFQFGNSVDISGDTMIVGSRVYPASSADAGAAYIFTRSGTTWNPQATLIGTAWPHGQFPLGCSVAIDGDTAVVAGGNESTRTCVAYVFRRSGSNWLLEQTLTAAIIIPDGTEYDYYDPSGISVALEGDTIVFWGMYRLEGFPFEHRELGAAYVFTRSGTTWRQQAVLKTFDSDIDWSLVELGVAVSGSTAMLASMGDAVYIYSGSGSSWTQQAIISASSIENAQIRSAVALNGDTVVIGGWGSGGYCAAYVFTRSGNGWTLQRKLEASDQAPYDYFCSGDFGKVAFDGYTAVIGAACDDDNGEGSGSAYVFEFGPSQNNAPPVADAGPDQTLECSSQSGGTYVTLNATGSSDPDGDPLTYAWTGPFEGSPVAGANPTVKLSPGCQGTYPITLVVNDGQEDSTPDEVVITIRDTTPPSITCPPSITLEAQGPQGVPVTDPQIQAFLNGASASDNCDPSPDLRHNAPVDAFPLGETDVVFMAVDVSGNVSSATSTVTVVVDTTPPEISIVAPQPYGLYAVGSLALDFSANDPVGGADLLGTLFDAQSSWPVEPGYVPSAGVYTLTVLAIDGAGNVAGPESVMFVVYDPEGGFVTGGGWIWSPIGPYPYMGVEGKANFGFVSKYRKGATVPTGNTEFVFQAGGLNFHSSSYEWLVVTGSDYARFKGSGTINGSGDYKFMLWAGDNEPDTFRIRIWVEDEITGAETPIYDNGNDQAIEGGSIIVHTK